MVGPRRFAKARPPIVSRGLLVLAAVCGVGTLAGSAAAANPTQPSSSAIAQYVEIIPTGSGGQAVGVGPTRTTTLPPRISQRIRAEAGTVAPTLEKVATSSDYGAPTPDTRSTQRPNPRAETRTDQRLARDDRAVPPTSVSHAVSLALPTAWSRDLLSAWLGLAIVTAAAFVAAGRRGRPETN